METPIIKRKKTASQLLKEFNLTVEEAELLLDEVFEICEKDQNEKDAQNANEMKALDISE